MQRLAQWVLISSFLAFSWLGFMAVHEFGHVLAAWLTGGSIERVTLHPLQISWTALMTNPHPQLVAWGGPVFGVLIPVILVAIGRITRIAGLYLLRFFAGFCLVANGVYLLIDAFERNGDGGALLRHGAAVWELFLFSVLTTPAGFWMWNGLGPFFGVGKSAKRVNPWAAIFSVVLLAVSVGWNWRFIANPKFFSVGYIQFSIEERNMAFMSLPVVALRPGKSLFCQE